MLKNNENSGLLIYENDNDIKVEVVLQNENVWMTQEQIGNLYNKSKSTINEHIKNIYEENELLEVNTMRKFGNSEFSTKPTNFYNLELIIAVGFRVKSSNGTKFRIWANEKLKEYLVKGYNINVGACLSIYIVKKLLKDKEFKEKYIKFLSLGNSKSIEEILSTLDIDIANNNFIHHGIEYINELLEELQKLLKEKEQKRIKRRPS